MAPILKRICHQHRRDSEKAKQCQSIHKSSLPRSALALKRELGAVTSVLR